MAKRFAVMHRAGSTQTNLTSSHQVLFTDECCVTLDGPDGWSSGCLMDVPKRLQSQQGRGRVMF